MLSCVPNPFALCTPSYLQINCSRKSHFNFTGIKLFWCLSFYNSVRKLENLALQFISVRDQSLVHFNTVARLVFNFMLLRCPSSCKACLSPCCIALIQKTSAVPTNHVFVLDVRSPEVLRAPEIAGDTYITSWVKLSDSICTGQRLTRLMIVLKTFSLQLENVYVRRHF